MNEQTNKDRGRRSIKRSRTLQKVLKYKVSYRNWTPVARRPISDGVFVHVDF